MATATIAVSVKARTSRASKKLKRFARTVKRLGASIRKVAARVAKAGIAFAAFGVAAAVAFQRITRAGERFNQKMNRSLAIMSGVSESLRKTMKRTALEVARTTVHSAEQAAEAYFFLASAGLSVKQSIAALPTVAQFAQAGMFDMARATDLLTDAQSALGLTVKNTQQNMVNMKRVSNVLVKANTMANASVEEFSEALTNKAGVALRNLNKDIEEGVAVLAAFADQGIKSAQAGTALDIVIRELTTKEILNRKAFAQYNIEVFESIGKMRNLASIVSDVEQALAKMEDRGNKATLMQLGFTNRSVSYMQALVGLSGRINEYETRLRIAGAITKRVSDKQLTPMEKALVKLKAAWVSLSDALKPAVDAVADLMETAATHLQRLADSLEPNAIVGWIEDSLNAMDQLGKRVGQLTRQMAAQFIMMRNIILKSDLAKLALAVPPTLLAAAIKTPKGEVGLGTRVRNKMDAAARRRQLELVKERWRGLWEDIIVGIKKAWFEAQRKPEGPGDLIGARQPASARNAGQFMQISPSLFHLPGLSAARKQSVMDTTAHGLLGQIVTNTRNNVAVTT